MRVSNLYACASTYLYKPTVEASVNSSKQNRRKVEPVSGSHTGRSYRNTSGTKANFASHIDICI